MMNFDMILKWLYIGVVLNPIGSAIFVWQHQILVNHYRCTQPSIGPLREVVTSCPQIFHWIPWQPCMIELAIDYLRRNAPLSVALSGISFFDRNLCCYDIPISNLRQTQILPLGHITVPPKCNTKHQTCELDSADKKLLKTCQFWIHIHPALVVTSDLEVTEM